jgi:hypothetical protein
MNSFVVLFFISVVRTAVVQDDSSTAASNLKVSIVENAPFAFVRHDGVFDGVLLDIFEQIASNNKWNYTLQRLSNIDSCSCFVSALTKSVQVAEHR